MSFKLHTPLTPYQRMRKVQSALMRGICIAFTASIVLILVLVTGYLISIGFKSLSLDFFTMKPTGDAASPGGMANGIMGTLTLIGLASVVGIPMGMLVGIYLSEYSLRSKLATPVRFISDVLSGVPSIVVGILGYELLVVPLGGYNGYAGALALAFIMVPIVARTTEEMLKLVPQSYREASIALGASKATTILKVVVPSATGSLVTGVMLAIARVAGETAPLLFTALGSRFMPSENGFSKPFPSLTVQIFEYASSPFKEQQRLAWAGILVLIFLIFILNVSVRFFTRSKHVGGH